jgi:PB1 domain
VLSQDDKGKWKYQGGDTFLESVPVTWKYSDFVFRLVEKTGCAVAVKYLLPGEELDPDSLITVSDDDDLQVSGACHLVL